MSFLKPIFLLLAAFILAACSLLPQTEKTVAGLTLLQPVANSPTQVLKQEVAIGKHGQEKQFIAVTRFTPKQTKLVALLPTGQTFLYLLHDADGFVEKNEAGMDLPSKDILAMIQFTYWPEAEVEKGYPVELGWRVEIQPHRRKLYYKNTLLLEVEINEKDIAITHHGDGYNVNIHTFDQEILPS